MFDKPIKTLQDAKEFFQFCGCSHLTMSRENPKIYKQYLIQKITSNQEKEWMKEVFSLYYKNILENKYERSDLWVVYNKMTNLILLLKTENELKKLLEVTRFLKNKMPHKDRMIVSDIIIGSFDNMGLIQLAYELKNIDLAKSFSELSLVYSSSRFIIIGRKRQKEVVKEIKNFPLLNK